MSFSLYYDDGHENTDDHRISEESERKQCEPLNNKSKTIDDSNQNITEEVESIIFISPLQDRKYNYSIPIDPNDGDRATGFRIGAKGRPHMRAFWAANLGHRATVFMWFSAVPLYPEISESLGLSESQLWTSAMCAIAGALISRFFVGFLCQRYGPRIPFAALIVFSSIPTALQGAVYTANQFYIVRFFVGIGGGSFVASECWLNNMFKRELAARVNGFSNGIGLAIALCYFFLRVVVNPLLRYASGSVEIGWRASFSIISLGSLCVGLPLIFLTDDTPRGNYSKLKKSGDIRPMPPWNCFCVCMNDKNIWILAFQHACNLGIELIINRVLYNYAKEQFNQNERRCRLISLSFSFCNQFGRVVGGALIDKAYRYYGGKGVLQNYLVYLCLAGVFFVLFSCLSNIYVALTILFLASFLTSYSQSATFGIVPYIHPELNEVVSGIIGSAGALGGIILGFIFREQSFKHAFQTTGSLFIIASFLTRFFFIPDYASLYFNEDCSEKDELKIVQSETNETKSSSDDSSSSNIDELDL